MGPSNTQCAEPGENEMESADVSPVGNASSRLLKLAELLSTMLQPHDEKVRAALDQLNSIKNMFLEREKEARSLIVQEPETLAAKQAKILAEIEAIKQETKKIYERIDAVKRGTNPVDERKLRREALVNEMEEKKRDWGKIAEKRKRLKGEVKEVREEERDLLLAYKEAHDRAPDIFSWVRAVKKAGARMTKSERSAFAFLSAYLDDVDNCETDGSEAVMSNDGESSDEAVQKEIDRDSGVDSSHPVVFNLGTRETRSW